MFSFWHSSDGNSGGPDKYFCLPSSFSRFEVGLLLFISRMRLWEERGTKKIADLKDGDKILILESCTHQVSCEDIGRFKIPRWLREFTKKQLEFDVVAGLSEIKNPITAYALVVQCGGCMITRKQVFSRLMDAIDAGVPVTNYGLTIAYINGIFDRAIEPFTNLIEK